MWSNSAVHHITSVYLYIAFYTSGYIETSILWLRTIITDLRKFSLLLVPKLQELTITNIFPLKYWLLIHNWNLHRSLFMKVRTVAILVLSQMKSAPAEKNYYVELFSFMFSKYNSTAVWFLQPSALICLRKIKYHISHLFYKGA